MPTVAITMRMTQAPNGEWRDAIAQDWETYLHAQGLEMRLVPNDPDDCLQYLDGADCLLLTGGDDIVLKSVQDVSDNPLARRDKTEAALLTEAIKRKLPVLGVCRGMELLQWYFGGMIRPLSETEKKTHVRTDHPARFDTAEWKSLLTEKVLTVNSFHSLGIEAMAKGLTPYAKSDDGLIESCGDESRKLLGVLWHPERPMADAASAAFHTDFVHRFLSAAR